MRVFEKASERNDTGLLLRDVMLDYVHGLTLEEKELTSQIDNRINILK